MGDIKDINITIHGLIFTKQKIVETPKGDVLRMLRPHDQITYTLKDGKHKYINSDFISAGEIYFSECKSGHIKDWKIHKNQNQLFCVPYGQVLIGVLDTRENSDSYMHFDILSIGRDFNYGLLKIPLGVHYIFTSYRHNVSIICNAPDSMHDPSDNAKVLINSNNDFIKFEKQFMEFIK